MNALAIKENTLTAPQELTQQLFTDFVAFIDRSAKTTRSYIINLRQFMAWLRYSMIKAPAREDVVKYRNWLAEEHPAIELDSQQPAGWRYRTDNNGNRRTVACRPNTIKAYLQSVRQFFTWTAANGYYPNIAANVHAPTVVKAHRKDSLTAGQVLQVENAISLSAEAREAAAAEAVKDRAGRMQRSTEQGARLYAMYLLAVNAGLRTIEISRANVEHLEAKGGQAWLYIWGKGHAEADKKKALAPAVYAAIRDYLKLRSDNPTGSSPLFVSTGNRSGGKRIAETTISKMLKKAMQQAGFDSSRITAHSLRHTAGQNVMQITGNNIYLTQQFMRHSKPETTEIYLDNNQAEQDARIAEQLYKHYHGEASSTAAEKLQAAAQALSPEKLEQLAAIAAAML